MDSQETIRSLRKQEAKFYSRLRLICSVLKSITVFVFLYSSKCNIEGFVYIICFEFILIYKRYLGKHFNFHTVFDCIYICHENWVSSCEWPLSSHEIPFVILPPKAQFKKIHSIFHSKNPFDPVIPFYDSIPYFTDCRFEEYQNCPCLNQ